MSAKSTFDALCGQGSGKQNRSTIRENDASYETDLESKQAAVNAKMKISTKSCLRRPKRLRRRCLKRSDSMHAVAELEVENDILKTKEAHLRARGAWLRQHINEVYGLNATLIAQRDALPTTQQTDNRREGPPHAYDGNPFERTRGYLVMML